MKNSRKEAQEAQVFSIGSQGYLNSFNCRITGLALMAVLWVGQFPAWGKSAPPPEPGRVVILGDTVIADHLRDRFSGCPSAHLISNGRAGTIVSEISPPFRRTPGDQFLAAFCEYLPADCIIRNTGTNDLELVLFLKDGVQRWTASPPSKGKPLSFLNATREAGAFIADTLKLPEEGRKHLTANSITNDTVFKAVYESRRLWASYPNNTGETKLRRLNPLVASNPNDPALAAEILVNAESLLSATRRSQDFAKSAIALAECALPCVLGTAFESSAYAISRRLAQRVEKDLLDHASLFASALDVELPKDLSEPSLDMGTELPTFDPSASSAAKKMKPTPTSALGALRVLGEMKSAKGLPVLLSAAKNAAADAREAAATALRHYEDPKSLAALQTLETDKNEDVAFAAAHSLWQRKTASAMLLPLARKKAAASGPWRESAVKVIADQGESQDIALLKTFSADPEPGLRLAAVRALLRLNALDDALRARLLRDGHESVLTTVIASLTSAPDAGTLASIRELTKDPVETIAESARLVLLPTRPQDRQQGILFDLELEHTYIRLKRLDELAAEPAGWAVDLLEKACSNRNFYVRAAALPLLQRRDAARGHAAALALMTDPCAWTRFAAARQLAADAEAKDADVLQKALETETDASTKLFFQDAVAKAAGKPPPEPPPAAHDIRGANISTWLCGLGEDCETSPFSAYYLFGAGYSEKMKKAHDAGKIFFCRASPIGNPGTILVNRKARDSFWIALEGELNFTNSLVCLDGLIFGEETMSMGVDALWPTGWRLFCLDAGIDPLRVKGSQDNLAPPEKGAWHYWAYEREVDGFNEMYDYVKTRLAKRRPGLQVGTFLPRETGATPADARWKFDLGGVYDYKGDNRMAAYNLIRSYKTQWPDRPVLWLSLGIGGYEMNPVKRGQKVPGGPFFTRHDRAYADTVTAWLAGGDAGWFSIWIFVDEKFKGGMHELNGPTVVAEDVFPGSKSLSIAVNSAFANALKYDEEKLVGPGPKIGEAFMGTEEPLPAIDLDADKNAAKAAAEKIRKLTEEKQRFYDGFCFYGQYVNDCARIFNGLPRLAPRPEALAIQPGVSVWTRPDSGYPGIPGMALLNEYDFLLDINQVTDLDLSHYRLIVAHSLGSALRDNTIAALSDWLKNRPGLLYVHGALNTNNAAEAATPADHDGHLNNDWPWEADLAAVFPEEKKTLSGDIMLEAGQSATNNIPLLCSYQILSPSARALLSTKDGKPVLVLWQKPDAFKGAVLFDAMRNTPKPCLEALRRELNALAAKGVGLTLNGPFLQETLESSNLVAAATTRYYGPAMQKKPSPGLDVMSGEKDPAVGDGSSGALAAKDYTGRYLHATPRLVVLAQNPFERCEKTADGAIVQGKGYFRVATESGRPPVLKPESGAPLSEVTTNVSHWILYGTEDGFANLTLDAKTGRTMTFFRSAVPVKVEP